MTKDLYQVKIGRINEGVNDSPTETRHAHTISVSPGGDLTVQGEKGGRMLSPGMWDEIVVRRLQDLPGAKNAQS